MARWSEDDVFVNGLKIHFYRTGREKPQVVFNHGAGDDGLCWTHIVRQLEKDYDVIMPDARGHGKSSSGMGEYSTQARVEDLAGLIQALNLKKPVVGGHSMGADSAMYLAAKFPELVRAVFLEDPPIFLPGEMLGTGDQMIKADDIGKEITKFMRMFKLMPGQIGMMAARKFFPDYPIDEIKPWVHSKRRLSFDFLNCLSDLKFGQGDPVEVFQHIHVPVLLFIGDREKMSLVSRETASQAVRINADVHVVHLEGASHDIRRTRFDGYMPALKEFLGSVTKA
jgi:N-formylmaleamate deformylase